MLLVTTSDGGVLLGSWVARAAVRRDLERVTVVHELPRGGAAAPVLTADGLLRRHCARTLYATGSHRHDSTLARHGCL